MTSEFDIVILGLSITSSWGNGHATTYRGLTKGLSQLGYRTLFLERDAEWYASNRDEPRPAGCVTAIYNGFAELVARFERAISNARLVILGSYVPDGIEIAKWITSSSKGHTAFYDIDTPVTMALLKQNNATYLSRELIPCFDAYFSFTGGPTLKKIERDFGSPMARALHCTVDQEIYRPVSANRTWELGYLGTYSADRQGALEELLLEPAGRMSKSRFVVAGPQFPADIKWPANVDRMVHLSPGEHPGFYAAQRFTLNVTREAMKQAGYSPSVRLFEAGACGAAIISDWWQGLDTIFEPGADLLIAETAEDVCRYLRDTSDSARANIGARVRSRVLAEHSPLARARQIEKYLGEMDDNVSSYSALRNGRGGQIRERVGAGAVSELNGHGASQESGRSVIRAADTGRIHESAGASVKNSSGDRSASQD